MNNSIVITNIPPQNVKIEESKGAVFGITKVYVNGVDVTVDNKAYVIVPTKVSELENNVGYGTKKHGKKAGKPEGKSFFFGGTSQKT